MSCNLCHVGNRDAPNHAFSFRHRKKLIQLFKEYKKAIEGKHPDKFQEIYEQCLTQLIVGSF